MAEEEASGSGVGNLSSGGGGVCSWGVALCNRKGPGRGGVGVFASSYIMQMVEDYDEERVECGTADMAGRVVERI